MIEDSGRDTQDTAAASIWGRISHDLRQPIQSLLLLTHLMSQMEDASQRQRTARTMEDTLLAAQDMLDTVALLAKLEAGSQAVTRHPCDLDELIGRVLAQLAGPAAELGADFRIRNSSITANSNARLLEMAVTGLVLNALKCQTGSRIDVATRRLRGQLRIEISFFCPAIAPAIRSAFFVEFRRQSDTIATAVPVAGLALLARIADHLGGSLDIAAPGKGKQRFMLTLP